MNNLKNLQELAKAATPGPWEYYIETGYEGHGTVITYTEDENGMRTIGDCVFKRLVTTEINKAYVAEANPRKILEMVEYIQKLEKELAQVHNDYVESCLDRDQLAEVNERAINKVYDKEFFLEIVREWKHTWMRQTQNSKEDYQNYFNRALGIDANMVHSLASRLVKAVNGEDEND